MNTPPLEDSTRTISWVSYILHLIVAVSADGAYSINKQVVAGRSTEALSMALIENAKAGKDTVIIISADASARHQAVVTVMEAARRSGMNQITFATQSSGSGGK